MKVEEARKASGISSNLREHWVIGFRSFDIGDYWKDPESDYAEALKAVEEIDAAKKSKPPEVVPLRKKKDAHNQPEKLGA